MEGTLILDVIVLAILIIAMVSGFRRGFVYAFVHTLGWILAILAGFAGAGSLTEQLALHTMLDENIYAKLSEKLTLSFDAATTSADSLPLILGQAVDTATTAAAEALAQQLGDLIMAIAAFLLIVFVIKLLCFLLVRLLSRKKNKSFIGFFDGLLGLIAGAIKGVLVVFLFLMILLPAVNLMAPESTELVMTALDSSRMAGTLYDANFLVLILSN